MGGPEEAFGVEAGGVWANAAAATPDIRKVWKDFTYSWYRVDKS